MITQEIRSLIGGISQQPPNKRHMEQLEEQINGFSSETNGLQKRPPTIHIGEIPAIPVESKIHIIHRDEQEKYIVALTGTEVRVWDIYGREKQVRYEEGTREYLKARNPKETLKIVTVADYSFILNTEKVARMKDTRDTDVWATQGALVYVKSGQYGRTYSVRVNGREIASHTTPSGEHANDVQEIDTNRIANILKGKSSPYATSTTGESWYYITGDIKTIETKDGFNGQSLKAIHRKVARFTDLPATAPEGFTVLISGEKGNSDDYYVVYKNGGWKETVKPNLKNTIDPLTLPLGLVNNGDNTFTVKPMEWNSRTVGDEESNEEPSFINHKIHDIFFFRNRLGFIAGESVVLSRSGDYFNFFLNSATDVVDTDTIDLTVSHNRISTLYHAVPYNQDLYLFSKSTQFILRADGVLTPKNSIINQVTEFESDTKVRPIGVGRNLYFTSNRIEYTTVNEYTALYEEGTSRDSQDITNHVPSLIKNGVYSLITSPNEHLIIALSEGQKDTMYVYKYLYLNEQKVQSSWSKWTINGEIIGADFIGSTLILVTKRGSKYNIEKLLITYDTEDYAGEPYRVLLDNKKEITIPQGSFNPNTLLYTYRIQGKYIVVDNGLSYEIKDGILLSKHNLKGHKGYIGEPYEFKAVLTTIYLKQADNERTITIPNYRLAVRNLKVLYSKSGEFDVKVDYTGRPSANYKMTARKLGMDNNRITARPISTGEFKVPVHSKNTEVSIELINDTPLPSTFTGLIWEGLMTTRHKFV